MGATEPQIPATVNWTQARARTTHDMEADTNETGQSSSAATRRSPANPGRTKWRDQMAPSPQRKNEKS